LMEETEWDSYGTGNYEKCANCMVHCGYEATAVADTVAHPMKALKVFLGGYRTDGDMAPEISLDNQRPAEYVFDGLVKTMTQKREEEEARLKASREAKAAAGQASDAA
jgi:hypothetical protein